MPRRRSSPLDRREIVRVALGLIDRDGLEALSMRRVARELRVEAMSLYHHVGGKEELIDACIEQVSASLDVSGMQAPGPWRERLKAGFTAYRALAHAHPHLFALVGHRPVQRLAVLRPVEVALGVFADAGFTPAQSMRGFRIVNSFVYGYALSELTGLAVHAASSDTLAGDPADFPNLIRALPHVRDVEADTEFERGLDTILDGISTWRTPSPLATAVRRFWEEAFNGRDLAVLDELIADEYVNEAALPGTARGAAGQAAVFQRLWAALPDARFEIVHLAVDGDVVICTGTMSGTHRGALLGVPASRRRLEWRMCHLMRFDAGGRAIEHSAIRDDLGLKAQMGAP